MSYSPLGRGFLTGKIRNPDELPDSDFRRMQPRFQRENLDANLAIVQVVEALAAEKGAAPAQIALAWVEAQGDDLVPIPGTKRRRYLEENAGAEDVRLTAEDLARIAEAGAPRGERYADMSSVNR